MSQRETEPDAPGIAETVQETGMAPPGGLSGVGALITAGALGPRMGATNLAALQSGIGNRAMSRLVRDSKRRLAREILYRGQASGGATAKEGAGVDPRFGIHDFGDGLYLTTNHAMAREYASDRAGANKGLQEVLRGDIPRGDLGRVLDLNADTGWRDYTTRPLYPNGPTPEALIKQSNENYWKFFQSYLNERKLTLGDYDAVIGPEYVRGGTQVCLRTAGVQAKARAALTLVERGANFEPVPPPSKPPPSGPPSSSGGTGPPGGGAPPTTPAAKGPGGLTAGRGGEVKPIENPAAAGQARGQALVGAAALVFSALNGIGDWIQERDAKDAWKAERPSVEKVLNEQPWMGALVIYRWSQFEAPSFSLNQPGRHFEGIEVLFAETEAQARNQERSAGTLMPGGGPGTRFSSDRKWLPPAAPGTKPAPAQAPAVDTSNWTDRQWIESRQKAGFADDKIFHILNGSSMQRILQLLREVKARDTFQASFFDFLEKRIPQVPGIWNDRLLIAHDATRLRGTPGALEALLKLRNHRVLIDKIESDAKTAIVRALNENRDD